MCHCHDNLVLLPKVAKENEALGDHLEPRNEKASETKFHAASPKSYQGLILLSEVK